MNDHISDEIDAQPGSWRRAVALAATVRSSLPASGTRLAVVGCGTSYHIAQAFATAREETGHGEADAFPASEMPLGRRYDAVLAISRSGTTTEVIRLLEGARTPTVALTAVPGSPIAELAGRTILLDFADEQSIVQTRFATTALALLRAHVGGQVETAARDAERALRELLPVDPKPFSHFVFLGRGWTVGLAHEAALKMRETSAVWAESYPAMEYRHGPISVAGEGTLVWAMGEVPGDLLDDVAATGARVVGNDHDPMAELVLVQRFAVATARAAGRDPDRPRGLSRSVVLE